MLENTDPVENIMFNFLKRSSLTMARFEKLEIIIFQSNFIIFLNRNHGNSVYTE